MAEQGEEKQKRSEYRVTVDDTLASLLERIRETPGVELLLDITDNVLLLKDGSLRRTLVSAATEFEKRVAFSFSEKQNTRKSVREEKPSQPVETKSAKTRQRGGESSAVPVTVFSQTKKAHPVKQEIPKIKLGESGKRIAVFFSFFAGILLAGGFFFVLPRAEIKIMPEVEPISMNLSLKASLTALNIDVEKGIVPAQVLNYEEAVSETFPVKGVLQQGEKASGQAVIVNKTVTEQKIKSKSRLSGGSDLVFIMDEAVTLAPHSSVTVKITADQGGTAGNIKKGRLYFIALPKTDQNILYADVGAPLSGGTDKNVSVLSKDDVENAKKQILTQKQEQIKEKIEQSLASDIVKNNVLYKFELADFSSVEKEGAQIKEFNVKGILRVRYLAFKYGDIFSLVEKTINKNNESNKQLSKKLETSGMTINNVDWLNNEANINYAVQNSLHEAFDISEIRNNLVGRTAQGAKDYLTGLKGVKDVSVEISPFWVKRIPGFKRNIKIELGI